MAIRFPRALSMAALAATLATGTAFAAQDLRGDCCEPQAKPMAAPWPRRARETPIPTAPEPACAARTPTVPRKP